jgi:flavin-dependent dehydrogenase
MRSDFDVVVVGAGPAGSATALRLARSGCRVALVERTLFQDLRVGESLAPLVQPLLAELGVWPDFLGLRPLPSYGTRSVWGADMPEEHSHISTPWGCGWQVDRIAFDRLLAECAVKTGASIFGGTSLMECEEQDRGWRLVLRGNGAVDAASTTLHTRVLIDATGRAAHLAVRLGAERVRFDRLIGIASLWAGIDNAQQGYVQVEAVREGWWYTAPVTRGSMMAMLMSDRDLCDPQHLKSQLELERRMQPASQTLSRVAGCSLSWGPRVFSAVSQRLRRRDRDRRWIAVGDAALAVDPISGSGVIRSLRSAQSGTETALAMLEDRTEEALAAYESANDRLCTEYLRERAAYYGIERRWIDSSFWTRRWPSSQN